MLGPHMKNPQRDAWVHMTKNNAIWLTIKIWVLLVASALPSFSDLKQRLKIDFQA